MCAKIARHLVLAAFFFTLGTSCSFAQATFSISSTPGTVADIGYAEPAGPIYLAVMSGSTVPAAVQVTYSAPITNNSASDISITGTGALAGIASSPASLDRTTNSILFNVPAGGVPGNQIGISGVRVAIAGMNLSQVTAFVSSPTAGGNAFIGGTTQTVVIFSVAQPFLVDESGTPPLSFGPDGKVAHGSTSFVIAEKYATAFSSSIGVGGQTVKTRILIKPFPADLLPGVQITFPATIPANETGAVFKTLSGLDETVPQQDGTTAVTYEFTAAAGSSTTIESFSFSASMTSTILALGTIQFQAEILPTGSLNDALPASIPRYAERLVPDESQLISSSGATQLIFPFRAQSDATYTGIAITNPLNNRVKATLTANDITGQIISGGGITNPVPIQIPANGQYYAVASAIFGSAFNASSAGVIVVAGQTPVLKGIYMVGDNSGPRLDGGVGDAQSSQGWYIPVVFHQGTAPFNRLEIYNPGNSAAQLTLKLMDANGNPVGSPVPKTLGAGALLSGDITGIFGINLNAFQGGYIKGESDVPLIATGTFGNALESNVLGAQRPTTVTSYLIPHFASGDQYSTELTLVNLDSSVASMTVTLLDDSGTAITAAANVSLNPGTQQVFTVAGLFPSLGSHLVAGSFKIDVQPVFHGIFPSAPSLLGAVRYSNVDGSGSSSVPIAMVSATDFVCSHIAENTGFFTGLALINSDINPANFTVGVYQDNGTLVGTYSSQLQPRQRLSKLIRELVPAAAGQLGGYFRVTSDAALIGFAAFASSDLRSISAIPLQKIQ